MSLKIVERDFMPILYQNHVFSIKTGPPNEQPPSMKYRHDTNMRISYKLRLCSFRCTIFSHHHNYWTYFFKKTATALVTAAWSTSLTVTPGIWNNTKIYPINHIAHSFIINKNATCRHHSLTAHTFSQFFLINFENSEISLRKLNWLAIVLHLFILFGIKISEFS